MANPDMKLDPNSFAGKRQGPVVVVVMDGVGLGPDYEKAMPCKRHVRRS